MCQLGISILTLKRRIKLDTCRCWAVHWITHCILSGSSPDYFPRNGSVWGQKITTDTMQAGVVGNLWRKIYWTEKWNAAVQAVSETNSQRIVWNVPHDTLAIFVFRWLWKRVREIAHISECAAVRAAALLVLCRGCCLHWHTRSGVPCDNPWNNGKYRIERPSES